jgi:hypothetical protein
MQPKRKHGGRPSEAAGLNAGGMLNSYYKADTTDWIAFSIAAIVVLCQVAVPPTIGLADNGDFPKIAAKFNLRPQVAEEDLYGHYATTGYVYIPNGHWDPGFLTTETALSWLAVNIGWALSRDGSFDLRLLGLLHSGLFLMAFALALPLFRNFQKGSRRLIIALAILIFADTMYVEYFSSFYMDTPAFLFLLLAAVLFLRARSLSSRPFVAFFLLACCCLFVLSKAQHALLGIPFAFFCLQDAGLLWASRPFLSRVTAIGLLAACSMFAFLHAPPGYASPALLTVIVRGLLPSAKNPSAELKELGLDDSFLRYAGMTAYSTGLPIQDPSWSKTFAKRTSYSKLALFYLRHPFRAAYVLGSGLDGATYQRTPYLGNFDKTAGYPPYTRSYRFSLWSDFKTNLLCNHGWAYLIYFLGLVAILARRYPLCGLVLATMALLELAIGALADHAENTRHLFIFNCLVDLIGICAAATLLRTVKQRST